MKLSDLSSNKSRPQIIKRRSCALKKRFKFQIDAFTASTLSRASPQSVVGYRRRNVEDGRTCHRVPYYAGFNSYQGPVPPAVIFGDPRGVPIQQTMYRDTPAPFNCPFCGNSGLTDVRSKPSLAALVGCLMTFGLGICFLCPTTDCLWHKYHYCPRCNEKLADLEKSDSCLVVDLAQWTEESYALPA